MNPFINDHPALDVSGGASWPRWACALGVIQAVLCAAGLTIPIL